MSELFELLRETFEWEVTAFKTLFKDNMASLLKPLKTQKPQNPKTPFNLI